MPTFTVYEPPLRKGESASDPERFAFVRDGFRVWAFLLPPLWMLIRRLWLVLVLYLALNVAVGIIMQLAGLQGWARFAVSALIGLLVGLEAATLERWTLARRGWRMLGTVIGDTSEDAERRFYDAWRNRDGEPPAAPAAGAPFFTPASSATMTGNSDVIGLFPAPDNAPKAGQKTPPKPSPRKPS